MQRIVTNFYLITIPEVVVAVVVVVGVVVVVVQHLYSATSITK